MIYVKFWSGELHADDYYLCYISDTSDINSARSHKTSRSSFFLTFCRNLKFNLILVLFCDGYYDDCCRSHHLLTDRICQYSDRDGGHQQLLQSGSLMPQDHIHMLLEIINLFVVINFRAFLCFIYFYVLLFYVHSKTMCEIKEKKIVWWSL